MKARSVEKADRWECKRCMNKVKNDVEGLMWVKLMILV